MSFSNMNHWQRRAVLQKMQPVATSYERQRAELARQRSICPNDADHDWRPDEPHGLTDTCVKCGAGRA